MAFYLMTYSPGNRNYDISEEEFLDELERFEDGEEVRIRWSIQAWMAGFK